MPASSSKLSLLDVNHHSTWLHKTHSIFDPAIVVPAIGESFKKLNPLHMVGNPVMFVTEVGAADHHGADLHRRRKARPSASCCKSRSGCGSRCSSPTSPRRWPKAAARRRPTSLRKARTETAREARARQRRRQSRSPPSDLRKGRSRHRRSRRADPRRRRNHRRRRRRRRIRHHRRIRAGHPRERRRPQRGHRRHARPFATGSRSGSPPIRRDLSRSHDRPDRRREAAEDAE